MLVYAESLPAWHQSDIAAPFGHSTQIMAECTIPARLSADWVIVTDYMVSARAAIVECFASLELEPHRRPSASLRAVDGYVDPPLSVRG